jgi:hypothetical protein
VNIANALWTPAVVEAYKLANPPVPEPQPEMIVPPMLPQVEPVLVANDASELPPAPPVEIVPPLVEQKEPVLVANDASELPAA